MIIHRPGKYLRVAQLLAVHRSYRGGGGLDALLDLLLLLEDAVYVNLLLLSDGLVQ